MFKLYNPLEVDSMNKIFSRTKLLMGEEKFNKLQAKNVAVFGIGGVGSYVVEALARCGINKISVVDKDVVDITNINRQIIALNSTVGMNKTDVAEARIMDINPSAEVKKFNLFFDAEVAETFPFDDYDYIVDAIDTVTSKLVLIKKAKEKNIPIISCMGTGGKLNPALFQVADINKTSVCPLARVMRRELKSRGITSLKVVFSTEQPIKSEDIIPSISFVPSSAGLLIASEVVKDLINN